jgi:hypothetical protein
MCLETLVQEINSGTDKMPLRLIQSGAPDEAVIDSADESGITTKEGESLRKLKWHDLQPKELERLVSRQFGFRNPKKLFLLSCLCSEIGLERQGNDWMESAIARDETGEIQRMRERMKGGWTPSDRDR